MADDYIPERGDLIWLQFDPQAGREQGGRRPALVLSRSAYNGRTGRALCCPITSQVKGYPYEVLLATNCPVHGVVLADHLKNLDWRARKADFIAATTEAVVVEVVAKAETLMA